MTSRNTTRFELNVRVGKPVDCLYPALRDEGFDIETAPLINAPPGGSNGIEVLNMQVDATDDAEVIRRAVRVLCAATGREYTADAIVSIRHVGKDDPATAN